MAVLNMSVPQPGGDTRGSVRLSKHNCLVLFQMSSSLLQTSVGLKEKQETHNLLDGRLESKWGSLEYLIQHQMFTIREQIQTLLFISTSRHLNIVVCSTGICRWSRCLSSYYCHWRAG